MNEPARLSRARPSHGAGKGPEVGSSRLLFANALSRIAASEGEAAELTFMQPLSVAAVLPTPLPNRENPAELSEVSLA